MCRSLLVLLLLPTLTWAGDFEREPISYSKATPRNAITQLQERMDAGKLTLTFDPRHGYARSLLQALNVDESSQTLVFSKTSLQRERIRPSTPRAIYFNDEVYVGYCQRGTVMEISVVDPQLGAVFYTLDQEVQDRPRFVRQTDTCLICHGSSQTMHVPGHVIRSVYADSEGYPLLGSGTYRIDQTSPLSQRWGGWYVTGTSGQQKHLGNLIVQGRRAPEREAETAGRNVTDLSPYFKTSAYLTPHSDIVALMVLEHQGDMHNLLTRASFLTRQALHEELEINKALGRPASHRSESTVSRIRSAGEPLVRYMLFSGETQLTEPLKGTTSFAAEFVQKGPRDRQGRSLRDLDLTKRLFKYPCSYLIYSPSFDALPAPVKEYVWRRLGEVLSGRDRSDEFAHLSAEDRGTLREILRQTKPDVPRSIFEDGRP